MANNNATDNHELFSCRILTCEDELFAADVLSVTLPGQDGEFMIHKNQAPEMNSLAHGLCTIEQENRHKVYFFIFGGVSFSSAKKTDIFVTRGSLMHNVTEDSLAAALQHFQESV